VADFDAVKLAVEQCEAVEAQAVDVLISCGRISYVSCVSWLGFESRTTEHTENTEGTIEPRITRNDTKENPNYRTHGRHEKRNHCSFRSVSIRL